MPNSVFPTFTIPLLFFHTHYTRILSASEIGTPRSNKNTVFQFQNNLSDWLGNISVAKKLKQV